MNRILKAFDNKKALIAYLTAGDPSLEKTKEFILTLAQNGADLIEIGIPFSDPVAEGQVIQSAMQRGLKSITAQDDIFSMVSQLRKESDVPIVFMSYVNPIFSYGYSRFFKRCREIGIDGIIIVDMPFEEHGEVLEQTQKNNVSLITLIAPTSNERINMLAQNASGFIYLISSLGVTGVRENITTDIKSLVERIKEQTQIPVAVGFGISKPEQAQEIARYADGIIIGSAIVKLIEEYKEDAAAHIAQYISSIKAAIS
jgi:tryptophan synthase alpha chain